MGFTAAAVVGGAMVVGAGASYLAAKSQGKAAERAANAQAAASQQGIDTQLEMYYQSKTDYLPFYKAGVNALTGLQKTPSGAKAPTLPSTTIDFTFDPNDQMYKIRQEEGEEAINRALVARGLYGSRPGINALTDFNTKLIADEVSQQYGRAVDKYGRDYTTAIDEFNIENKLVGQEYGKYLDLTKLGAGAAQSMGQSAIQTGQGVATQYGQIGNALAQGQLGEGQAQAGMWQDIGGLPVNALASYYYGQKAGIWK